jgi:hypothetical protein
LAYSSFILQFNNTKAMPGLAGLFFQAKTTDFKVLTKDARDLSIRVATPHL